MKIITPSTANAESNRTESPDELTRHHPARLLFTLTVIEVAPREATLRLHWHHPDPNARGASRSALGCVVDYAAKLSAWTSLGHSDVAECELQSFVPFTASALLVTASINVTHGECAVYQCTVYALEKQQRTLVASSRGTLLKRPLD